MFAYCSRHELDGTFANGEFVNLNFVSCRICLQCSEKCDKRLFVFDREPKRKLVTLNWPPLHAVPFEACGYVVVAQASRIEPILQRSHGAVMLEWPAIPH